MREFSDLKKTVATESVCNLAGPALAVVLLWFPLASETFIFRELSHLRAHNLPVLVYTMYGRHLKGCSRQMRDYDGPVVRMGIAATFAIFMAFFKYTCKSPRKVWKLARRGLFRRMRNLESLCENIWCFMAGFLLAEKLVADGVGLIHAPWANGPATAAWVASALTGIPFSFAGRAGDIYPQDGILAEKAADAAFIRVNNAANIRWLASFCSPGQTDKIKLIYNGLLFDNDTQRNYDFPEPPYKILAVGRFARTKGFTYLLTAIARLKRENFPVMLTLVGDGSWRGKLVSLRKRLGLEDCVAMPGFVPNDQLVQFMENHDLLVVPSVVHSNGDRDGIPNVIMEALSLGLPVVATDVCGISEVIHDGETGYLVCQRNSAALARAIRLVFEDWSTTVSMAAAGKKLVAQMFDPQTNGEALWELCCNAMKNETNV